MYEWRNKGRRRKANLIMLFERDDWYFLFLAYSFRKNLGLEENCWLTMIMHNQAMFVQGKDEALITSGNLQQIAMLPK